MGETHDTHKLSLNDIYEERFYLKGNELCLAVSPDFEKGDEM